MIAKVVLVKIVKHVVNVDMVKLIKKEKTVINVKLAYLLMIQDVALVMSLVKLVQMVLILDVVVVMVKFNYKKQGDKKLENVLYHKYQ